MPNETLPERVRIRRAGMRNAALGRRLMACRNCVKSDFECAKPVKIPLYVVMLCGDPDNAAGAASFLSGMY